MFVCLTATVQQSLGTTAQPAPETVTGLPLGGTQPAAQAAAAGGAAAPSTNYGISFIKIWPTFTDAEFTAMCKRIALAFYACNLPHSLVDNPDFRDMLLLLAPFMKDNCPHANSWPPPCWMLSTVMCSRTSITG